MLRVTIGGEGLRFGSRLEISLRRTLRVPADGRAYPLPPDLGAFELFAVRRSAKKLPAEMARRGGAFLCLRAGEALWIRFEGRFWRPLAVQVGAGGVNAVTGGPFPAKLSATPQNYVVAPLQPWLDGFKTGAGVVRQFVGGRTGRGATVEEQLGGGEPLGGLRFRAFEAKPGKLPAREPRDAYRFAVSEGPPLGLGAGGAVEQGVYPDPYGVRIWDAANYGEAEVHFLGPAEFERVTGRPAPPKVVDAATYTKHGLPWFQFYEDRGALEATEAMRGLKPAPAEAGVEIPERQVVRTRRR